MTQNSKRLVTNLHLAVVCGLIFSILLSICGFSARCDRIRGRVFRLHILANSDTEEDQACKLAVRDRLLREGELLFSGAHNEAEAAAMAAQRLPQLQAAAQDEVIRQGYDYPVRVEVARCRFNTRVYEETTLPAGEYEALRVILGDGAGHNWWCVMFPPMCLPAAQESEELSQVLEEDDLEIVEGGSRYEIKFKAVELYESVSQKLKEWFR